MNDLWTWITLAALLLGTLSLIVKFDINEWLKERRRQKKENLPRHCPHARFIMINGQPGVQVEYISPSGTLAWRCQMCGHVTHNERMLDEIREYWLENPEKLAKQLKIMEKKVRRL